MITALLLLTRLVPACSAGNCSRPECPRCGECVLFCNCPPPGRS